MIRGLLGLIGRVIGLLTGAYLAFIAVRGSRLLVQPEVRPFLPDPPGAPATPADLGLEYETVRFTTDDGVTLTGWFVPSARETRTAVIVMHGFSGHRLPELAAFVPWLQSATTSCSSTRGHGESDASTITLGTRERRDVAAAVRFLEGRGSDRSPSSREHGSLDRDRRGADLPVRAGRATAAFAELHTPDREPHAAVGYPLAELGARAVVAGAMLRTRSWLAGPLQAVGRIAPRPLLLIAPREDRLISWRQSLRLYEAAGEPKELMVVEGAAHAEAYAVAPEAYRRRVLGFLERHLGR